MTRDVTIDALTERLIAMTDGPGRRFAAIAGPPGSGKSHVAEALFDRIDAARPGTAAILPMDGYHFDDTLLRARGDLPRKGAPHTFDVEGFGVTLERLSRATTRSVVVPVFDRSIEIARAGAREIPPGARLILVEGNYLLLDRPDWAELRPFFDLTVMLDVPEEVLRARLAQRWTALSGEDLERKLEGNDYPNMALVLSTSVPADLRLRNLGPVEA